MLKTSWSQPLVILHALLLLILCQIQGAPIEPMTNFAGITQEEIKQLPHLETVTIIGSGSEQQNERNDLENIFLNLNETRAVLPALGVSAAVTGSNEIKQKLNEIQGTLNSLLVQTGKVISENAETVAEEILAKKKAAETAISDAKSAAAEILLGTTIGSDIITTTTETAENSAGAESISPVSTILENQQHSVIFTTTLGSDSTTADSVGAVSTTNEATTAASTSETQQYDGVQYATSPIFENTAETAKAVSAANEATATAAVVAESQQHDYVHFSETATSETKPNLHIRNSSSFALANTEESNATVADSAIAVSAVNDAEYAATNSEKQQLQDVQYSSASISANAVETASAVTAADETATATALAATQQQEHIQYIPSATLANSVGEMESTSATTATETQLNGNTESLSSSVNASLNGSDSIAVETAAAVSATNQAISVATSPETQQLETIQYSSVRTTENEATSAAAKPEMQELEHVSYSPASISANDVELAPAVFAAQETAPASSVAFSNSEGLNETKSATTTSETQQNGETECPSFSVLPSSEGSNSVAVGSAASVSTATSFATTSEMQQLENVQYPAAPKTANTVENSAAVSAAHETVPAATVAEIQNIPYAVFGNSEGLTEATFAATASNIQQNGDTQSSSSHVFASSKASDSIAVQTVAAVSTANEEKSGATTPEMPKLENVQYSSAPISANEPTSAATMPETEQLENFQYSTAPISVNNVETATHQATPAAAIAQIQYIPSVVFANSVGSTEATSASEVQQNGDIQTPSSPAFAYTEGSDPTTVSAANEETSAATIAEIQQENQHIQHSPSNISAHFELSNQSTVVTSSSEVKQNKNGQYSSSISFANSVGTNEATTSTTPQTQLNVEVQNYSSLGFAVAKESVTTAAESANSETQENVNIANSSTPGFSNAEAISTATHEATSAATKQETEQHESVQYSATNLRSDSVLTFQNTELSAKADTSLDSRTSEAQQHEVINNSPHIVFATTEASGSKTAVPTINEAATGALISDVKQNSASEIFPASVESNQTEVDMHSTVSPALSATKAQTEQHEQNKYSHSYEEIKQTITELFPSLVVAVTDTTPAENSEIVAPTHNKPVDNEELISLASTEDLQRSALPQYIESKNFRRPKTAMAMEDSSEQQERGKFATKAAEQTEATTKAQLDSGTKTESQAKQETEVKSELENDTTTQSESEAVVSNARTPKYIESNNFRTPRKEIAILAAMGDSSEEDPQPTETNLAQSQQEIESPKLSEAEKSTEQLTASENNAPPQNAHSTSSSSNHEQLNHFRNINNVLNSLINLGDSSEEEDNTASEIEDDAMPISKPKYIESTEFRSTLTDVNTMPTQKTVSEVAETNTETQQEENSSDKIIQASYIENIDDFRSSSTQNSEKPAEESETKTEVPGVQATTTTSVPSFVVEETTIKTNFESLTENQSLVESTIADQASRSNAVAMDVPLVYRVEGISKENEQEADQLETKTEISITANIPQLEATSKADAESGTEIPIVLNYSNQEQSSANNVITSNETINYEIIEQAKPTEEAIVHITFVAENSEGRSFSETATVETQTLASAFSTSQAENTTGNDATIQNTTDHQEVTATSVPSLTEITHNTQDTLNLHNPIEYHTSHQQQNTETYNAATPRDSEEFELAMDQLMKSITEVKIEPALETITLAASTEPDSSSMLSLTEPTLQTAKNANKFLRDSEEFELAMDQLMQSITEVKAEAAEVSLLAGTSSKNPQSQTEEPTTWRPIMLITTAEPDTFETFSTPQKVDGGELYQSATEDSSDTVTNSISATVSLGIQNNSSDITILQEQQNENSSISTDNIKTDTLTTTEEIAKESLENLSLKEVVSSVENPETAGNSVTTTEESAFDNHKVKEYSTVTEHLETSKAFSKTTEGILSPKKSLDEISSTDSASNTVETTSTADDINMRPTEETSYERVTFVQTEASSQTVAPYKHTQATFMESQQQIDSTTENQMTSGTMPQDIASATITPTEIEKQSETLGAIEDSTLVPEEQQREELKTKTSTATVNDSQIMQRISNTESTGESTTTLETEKIPTETTPATEEIPTTVTEEPEELPTTTLLSIVEPEGRSLALPPPKLEYIQTQEGVEVFYGYSSVKRN